MKYTIPQVYKGPSSWRSTLILETCRRHQKRKYYFRKNTICWLILHNYITTHNEKKKHIKDIKLPTSLQ